MKTQATSLISDSQAIVSAKTRFGHDIPVFDDGYGPLFLHRDSMGISGIVRAQTWEDAYSICEDEFFPEASDKIEEIRNEYNNVQRFAKIVWDHAIGREREAVYPDDYATGILDKTKLKFLRFDTITTSAPDGEDVWMDNELFQEAFGFRPSGPNQRDTIKHGIYAKDLNGDYLEELTPTLLKELEITLEISDNK